MHAPLTPARTFAVLALFAAAAVVVLALALVTGSVSLAPSRVVAALLGRVSEVDSSIVLGLRLPRALAAFAVGALLALSGALMQVLLRNPLADPYVLGISGGAAAGALGVMLLGAGALVGPAAFAGALASTLLVFTLARAAPERAAWTSQRLLLTGVVVAAGWGAVIALLLTLAPAAQVKGMVFWLLGDLAGASRPAPAWIALAIALACALAFARDLNAFARGDSEAAALGVAVPKVAFALHVIAAFATAAAVTTAGSVGFVGLIVPHALRLVFGNDQRLLLPASALAGGTLLLAADTLARSVASPLEIPVGVITALVGVPVFLYLLQRSR
jgi:iron complex transport system permease protein